MEKFSIEYIECIYIGTSAHIGAVALGNDAAVLALSHWRLYLSWPALQAVFSVVYMSVTMVSQYESSQ